MEGFRASNSSVHSPSWNGPGYTCFGSEFLSLLLTPRCLFCMRRIPDRSLIWILWSAIWKVIPKATKLKHGKAANLQVKSSLLGFGPLKSFKMLDLFGQLYKVPCSSIFRVWPWGLNLRFQAYYLRQQQIKPRSAWFGKWFVMNIYNLEARLNDGLRIIKATCQMLIVGYLPIAFNIISSWCRVQNPALMVPHL